MILGRFFMVVIVLVFGIVVVAIMMVLLVTLVFVVFYSAVVCCLSSIFYFVIIGIMDVFLPHISMLHAVPNVIPKHEFPAASEDTPGKPRLRASLVPKEACAFVHRDLHGP